MNLPIALSITALSLAALSGCNENGTMGATVNAAVAAAKAADPSTPGGAMTIALADLKSGELTPFFKKIAPAKSYVELQTQWERFCSSGMSADDEAEFNEVLRSLTLNGSELLLFERIKPSLEGAEQQAKALASMGPTLASGALAEMGVEAERGMVAIQSMASVLGKVDIGSEKKAKKAISVACKAARSLRIFNAHTLQQLGFEEAFAKVDIMYVTLMDLMDVYGVSLRGSIQSIEARTVAVDGDTAYMELNMNVFGTKSTPIPFEMTRVGGRWELQLEEQVAQ